MRRIIILVLLLGVSWTPLQWAQSPTSSPAPELQKWDIWVGDWTFTGTAKDTPTDTEYKMDWRMQGRWILGGHFVEVRGTWKGKGAESTSLEILSYDPVRRIHAFSGFETDGATWVATAKFTPGICIETGTTTGPDGKDRNMAKYVECKPGWNVHLGKGRSGAGRRSLDGIYGQGNQGQASRRKLAEHLSRTAGWITKSDGMSSTWRSVPQRLMKTEAVGSMLWRGVWSRGLRPYWCLKSPRMSLTRDALWHNGL